MFALSRALPAEPISKKKELDPPKKETPIAQLNQDLGKSNKEYDETILAHFKVGTDTASLMAYLKNRSSSDEDLLSIPDLIKQLGNEKFLDRQAASKKLIELGLPAVLPLCDALNDKDSERSRMAKVTLEKIDRGTHTLSVPPAAIRLLMKRRPAELLEVLLRYLPFTTDPEVEEDLYYNIDELALSDGKVNPALVKALNDRLPARRAVAGCIIARIGTVEQKRTARNLLKDADPHVRLRTAQGFLAGLETTGIPTLIDLLDAKPVFAAWQAEELLSWAAGGNSPKELVWDGGERAKKARTAWEKWRKQTEAKLDLKIVAKSGKRPGLFLTTGSPGHWRATQLVSRNGVVRWQFGQREWASASVQLLPNDRVFVIQWCPGITNPDMPDKILRNSESRLAEYDISGKERWSYHWADRDWPWNAARLANGLTWIGVCQVVDWSGRIVSEPRLSSSKVELVGSDAVRIERKVDVHFVHEGRAFARCVVEKALVMKEGKTTTETFQEIDPMSGAVIYQPDYSKLQLPADAVISRGKWLTAYLKEGTVLVYDQNNRLSSRMKADRLVLSAQPLRNGHMLLLLDTDPKQPVGPLINRRIVETNRAGERVLELSVERTDRVSPAFSIVELGFHKST